MISRREIISALAMLGIATAAEPFAASAQQAMPVIGCLNSQTPPYDPFVASFHRGLDETGFVEGRNVEIEYRWAENDFERLPVFAADLVRRRVAVIVAGGTAASAHAAKAATTIIPIVSIFGADPARSGLVASLNRPGGNLTGVTAIAAELTPKRLEQLRELVPSVTSVAYLANPNNPSTGVITREMEEAARTLGLRLNIVTARSDDELETAFARLVQQGNNALLVSADAFFGQRRAEIVALAARHGVPASYSSRTYVHDGGLIGYGNSVSDVYRQLGVLAGRILKGAKPADLPVEQPIRFELAVNLKTAKALGITIPQSILHRADEVIE